ncbi:MAG: rubredoxin [Hydrogenothermaceae bacterium]
MKIISRKPEKVLYRCRVCGYVYDSLKGDPVRGISPGVCFIDLPDNWRCPICKYTKKEFREIKL